jgi:hypothetical protein
VVRHEENFGFMGFENMTPPTLLYVYRFLVILLYYHYSYNERVRESVHVVLARVRLRSSLLNVFYSYHFFCLFLYYYIVFEERER